MNNVKDDDPQYLTPEDLHARWKRRVAIRTLSNWRSLGSGPKYTKVGGRILYPLKEVLAWEGRRTTDSTSGYGRMAVVALALFASLTGGPIDPWSMT